MLDLPIAEILWLGAALMAAGIVTGLLAGLFGVGGGGIIVPVLYQTFVLLDVAGPVRMPLAIGTSLAIIVPTSLSSLMAHYRRGSVDFALVRLWLVTCILGVISASVIASVASPVLFKVVFVIVVTMIGLSMISGHGLRIADTMPGPWVMRAIGYMIGLISTLMGVAGGSIVNIAMTLHGRTIHQAVGTAAGLGVVISLPGTIGYMLAGQPQQDILPPLSIGYVSVIGFLLIAPTSMLFAPLGARLAHRLSKRRLEVAFGIFLLCVSARFALNLVTNPYG